jgi:alginate O-acetyltransferase complex protein AlgI
MVFASAIFLYWFLPVFLAVYYLGPRRMRSPLIAVASYVFYGWWRPDFVVLMWISTVVDYASGHGIVRDRAAGRPGRRWVWLSLVTNLGLLGYFKYANFGVDTLNALLAPMGVEPLGWVEVVLPVGISFYTFQTISYTVDVYRGAAAPVRRFGDFMCYVAMFPQLVAGPIVRYNSIADQLRERTHSRARFFQGVLAFQAGLAKKVLLADVLAPVADGAFHMVPGADGAAAALAPLTTLDAWVGVLAYAFQIYFDFSGYSDMAIGLGLMMGFRLPLNFDGPYRAVGITDFWRRWHISLSAFLRDYLYIPLGGNRRGRARTYVNLSATMLLGGLWHGAAWTYVAWGAWQGAWLVLERLMGKRSVFAWAPRPVAVALTFVIVMIGWVFFRAETLGAAGDYVGVLFGSATEPTGSGLTLDVRRVHVVVGAVAAALVWLAPTTQALVARPRTAVVVAAQVFFAWSLLHLHYQDHVPFLYFQF